MTKHVTLVLGSNKLMWFFPTAPEADPYNFPIFRCKEEDNALLGLEDENCVNREGDEGQLNSQEDGKEGEEEEVLSSAPFSDWNLRRAKGKEKVSDETSPDLLLSRNTRKEE